MIWAEVSCWVHCKNLVFITVLFQWNLEFGIFLKFIYFSFLAISMNFPDQLVIVIRNPILEN